MNYYEYKDGVSMGSHYVTVAKANHKHPHFETARHALSVHDLTASQQHEAAHKAFMASWNRWADDSHLLSWNEAIFQHLPAEYRRLDQMAAQHVELGPQLQAVTEREAELQKRVELQQAEDRLAELKAKKSDRSIQDDVEALDLEGMLKEGVTEHRSKRTQIDLAKALKVAVVIGLVIGIIAAGVYGGMVIFAGAALKAAVTHITGIAGTYLASQVSLSAGVEIAINVVANLLAPIAAAVLSTGFVASVVVLFKSKFGGSPPPAPSAAPATDSTDVPAADPSLANLSSSPAPSAEDGDEVKQDSGKVLGDGEPAGPAANESAPDPSERPNPDVQHG